mgnify:CR=1 FL=1|tara:strand:- start:861 stop:1790 length:930 start_codon:yes stop_codon:yes gene_type:complete
MKSKLIYIFFIIILSSISNESKANLKNNIVLKVEDHIVTSFEVKNKILSLLIVEGVEINQENIDKLKKQSLDSLIQTKLKKIELGKYDFKANEKQIDQYLRSISQNDVEGLKKKFEVHNLDFEIFLDEIITQFKWQQFIYAIYDKKIVIDEDAIENEIKVLVKNNSNVEEYNLSEIEVLLNNDTNDNNMIANLKKQIEIEGFETTAKRFSISPSSADKGKLGWVNSKSLSKKIYNIVNEMSLGEVSKPIKGQNNVIFLKLNNKRTKSLKNLDLTKLKNNLIKSKRNELFNLYSRSHLSKLKSTNLIEYK